MDRLELRMANLLSPGEYVRPGGKPLDADLRQDLQEAARVLGWGKARERNVGRAVAVGLLAAGAQPVSKALVRLEADASATVLVSSTEMGQGVRTVMAQIVAQETGVPLERIRVPGGDTAVTPYDRSTGASRSTTLAGLAVQRAARHVKDQLLAILSDMADVPPEVVELRDGAAWFGDQRIPLDEIVRRYFGMAGGEIIGHGEVRPHDGRSEYAEGPVFWEVCVGGAEVEVDPDTGRVKVRRLVSVADVGKAVNPRLIEGQEMGAALQGLGNALFEEMLFQDGVLLNSTLLDYRIPSIEDLPHDFQSVIVERGDGPGPYGVRGVGEGAQAGAIAAIAAALWDAGVRVTQLPCTPERCWRALRNNQDKG
jgi:CO/xanthine dehydrogenase Mo-binding subunit